MLQKTGKWNAMHVRIAWEIYNHQKSKTEAKPGPGLTPSSAPGAGPKLGTFGDLLSKPGGVPGAGAEYGKRPAPAPGPAPAPATLFPGLPPPPNPFDPRDPFGAQRYYGTSHLGNTDTSIRSVEPSIYTIPLQAPTLATRPLLPARHRSAAWAGSSPPPPPPAPASPPPPPPPRCPATQATPPPPPPRAQTPPPRRPSAAPGRSGSGGTRRRARRAGTRSCASAARGSPPMSATETGTATRRRPRTRQLRGTGVRCAASSRSRARTGACRGRRAGPWT